MSLTVICDGQEVSFSSKGLQAIYDRAALRRSVAEQEGDEREATLAFSEQLVVTLFASLLGFPVDRGVIGEVEDRRLVPWPMTVPSRRRRPRSSPALNA